MLSEDDVDTVLLEIIAERVDEVALDVLHLVVKLAQEALFVVAANLGDSRIGACDLLAQVVAHLGPERLQLSYNGLTFVNKSDTLFCDLLTESLFNVEAH